MDSWRHIWLTGVLVTMTCGGADAGPHGAEPRVTVVVVDYAAVDPVTMREAQRIAGEVYRGAGIEIEWIERSTDEDATRLSVEVLTAEMAAWFRPSTETVGVATPGSRAASVFYERIRVTARRRHVDCGVLLGYVIAHEVGHLLLPAHSHSDLGVMRANLDLQLAAANRLRFTADQVALMQERLMVSPVISTQ